MVKRLINGYMLYVNLVYNLKEDGINTYYDSYFGFKMIDINGILIGLYNEDIIMSNGFIFETHEGYH